MKVLIKQLASILIVCPFIDFKWITNAVLFAVALKTKQILASQIFLYQFDVTLTI